MLIYMISNLLRVRRAQKQGAKGPAYKIGLWTLVPPADIFYSYYIGEYNELTFFYFVTYRLYYGSYSPASPKGCFKIFYRR